MSSIDHLIRQLAPDGIRINLWRSERGFQANVAEPGVNAWTVVTKDDPVEAVQEALRQRAGGIAIREVMAVDGFVDAPRDDGSWTERQTDLEEAIAAAPAARVLCWHPESSSLFESDHFDPGDGLVENVTDHPVWEERFRQQQATGSWSAPAAADDFAGLIG